MTEPTIERIKEIDRLLVAIEARCAVLDADAGAVQLRSGPVGESVACIFDNCTAIRALLAPRRLPRHDRA